MKNQSIPLPCPLKAYNLREERKGDYYKCQFY